MCTSIEKFANGLPHDPSVYSSPTKPDEKDSLNDRIRQYAPTKISDVSVGGGAGGAYACVLVSK